MACPPLLRDSADRQPVRLITARSQVQILLPRFKREIYAALALRPNVGSTGAGDTVAGDNHSCDVLLIVATDVERNTLLERAKDRIGHNYTLRHEKLRTYYELGSLGGARLAMVQCEMGSSGPGASQATVSVALDDLKPEYAVMVGVAFGVDPDKQRIGEILISRQLKPYELQRIGSDQNGGLEIKSRGDKVTASPRLLSRLRSACPNWTGSSVKFELMLSGEKLVDNLDFRDQLLKFEAEAVGTCDTGVFAGVESRFA